MWDGARVVAVRQGAPEAVSVTISRRGDYTQLNARLVVAADGAASSTRRLAGIGCRRRRLSSMLGFVLPGGRLPHPGFGTVFIDGPAPALAYQIGPDSVRVMFDVPDNPHGVDVATRDLAYLAALPPLLREDVRQAMDARRGLASASYSVVPDAVARHRVVLVGDAAGCCHPLTATGLSVCTRDAVRLRDALRASGGDVPAALRHYARPSGPARSVREWRWPRRSTPCSSRARPRRVYLRQGLLRYWESSPRGRAASMTLLSTEEGRMSVMAREYAWVVRYTLAGLRTRPEPRPLGVRTRAAFGLSLAALRYAGEMLRGLWA